MNEGLISCIPQSGPGGLFLNPGNPHPRDKRSGLVAWPTLSGNPLPLLVSRILQIPPGLRSGQWPRDEAWAVDIARW